MDEINQPSAEQIARMVAAGRHSQELFNRGEAPGIRLDNLSFEEFVKVVSMGSTMDDAPPIVGEVGIELYVPFDAEVRAALANAEWDDEAGVYIAEGDRPGLLAEARTMVLLAHKLAAVLRDLKA